MYKYKIINYTVGFSINNLKYSLNTSFFITNTLEFNYYLADIVFTLLRA